MHRRLLIALLLFTFGQVWADSEPPGPDSSESRQEASNDQEWESKGVIPSGGLTVSTQAITPISVLPERHPYEQAFEEMNLAQDLLKKGKPEAASDVALQAYDDLMSLSLPRRDKKKRQKLRQDRHQAATVYIDSSIAYIEEFAKKGGDTRKVKGEARARLGDLRDVSQNYPELNKKLSKALEQYSVEASSSTNPSSSSPKS